MSEQPRKDQDWIDLYEYVKKEIMGYTEDLKLPKYMILRLKGLSNGQFLANKKAESLASYDMKTILFTFKAYRQNILGGFRANNTKFTNEQHKFNYALVIVESNINDMVIRLKNAKSAKTKAENINMDNIFHKGAEYKTKTKEASNTLDDLW
ncbi:MAG TPA: hypothetical protein VIM70_06145 [Clostridium sp.]|uniref:hypothetical protein n=1 Tax=Clostridium sp. TaxID=1506 RepID=UPI002F955976